MPTKVLDEGDAHTARDGLGGVCGSLLAWAPANGIDLRRSKISKICLNQLDDLIS
jgi:hypothetical protein